MMDYEEMEARNRARSREAERRYIEEHCIVNGLTLQERRRLTAFAVWRSRFSPGREWGEGVIIMWGKAPVEGAVR